jgi:hypothetical protein
MRQTKKNSPHWAEVGGVTGSFPLPQVVPSPYARHNFAQVQSFLRHAAWRQGTIQMRFPWMAAMAVVVIACAQIEQN